MSEKVTWAVLTDGRYIRVLFNNGQGKQLQTLNADDNQALADLSFEVVRGLKRDATNGTASKTRTDMQLLSDFLVGEKKEEHYDALIIAAPQKVTDELKGELPDVISSLITHEVDEDIIAKSVDEIEEQLADLL